MGTDDRLKDDERFITELFKKIDINISPQQVRLLICHNDYDDYEVRDDQGRFLRVKISFEKDSPFLKRESNNLKSAQSPVCGYWLASGNVKFGDDFSYLLCGFRPSETAREIGRSVLLSEHQTLFDCYRQFQQTKPIKRHYKTVFKQDIDQGNLKRVLSKEEKERVEAYTDYNTLQSLVLEFGKQASNLLPEISPESRKKCHGKLSPDSIFWGGDNFYFDTLYNNCMGHPFVDFIELMLESGFSRDHEKHLLPVFCEYIGVELDMRLYQKFYNCLMRKKIADLISAYIYEVYLFNSYRVNRILDVADTFSHCYERFRSVPLFEDNREFVLKTLTEPILGVKA